MTENGCKHQDVLFLQLKRYGPTVACTVCGGTNKQIDDEGEREVLTLVKHALKNRTKSTPIYKAGKK